MSLPVALDTNVLVSAFVARGLCADLLRLVLTDGAAGSSYAPLVDRLPPTEVVVSEQHYRQLQLQASRAPGCQRPDRSGGW